MILHARLREEKQWMHAALHERQCTKKSQFVYYVLKSDYKSESISDLLRILYPPALRNILTHVNVYTYYELFDIPKAS